MRIIECTEDDAARWDAFVDAAPGAAFFHLFGWKGILGNALGHRTFYLAAEEDGELRAVLPLVRVRSRLFGDTLSSLAFCAHAGTLSTSAEAATRVEDEALDLARRLGVDSLEYRRTSPGGAGRLTKDLYDTFAKPIEPDADANMKAIRSKQRNVIRKGMKSGLVSREDDLDGFYPAYAESVRNLGTPVFPRALFAAIHAAFPGRTEFFSACLDGRVISSAMNFYHRDAVCPYFWGGVYDARRLSGNDFLAWEILCRAAARGCTRFDFGRSKKGTGSYRWKENLGFEPAPLYYEYDLVKADSVPDVNPLNPKYRLFVSLWKKLPLPVATRLGPFLARNLG